MQPKLLLQLAILLATTSVALLAAGSARAQYGPFLTNSGAVNQSFAGVATAAPLSAGGALLWNPASMPGLERSELEAGATLLFPTSRLASSIPAGALGPGLPPVGLAGDQGNDVSIYPLPSFGLVYLPENSPWSFGFGAFALAGFGVNYPGSFNNPLTTAPPPQGVGLGPIFSQDTDVQIAPAVAYQLTDRLSIGGGPLVDLAFLQVNPGLFAPVLTPTGLYPPGTNTRTEWGGGFMLGVYYQGDSWSVGSSFKSKQWLSMHRYHILDAAGRPEDVGFHADLPMIVSAGAAYTGWEDWVLATDVRYLDFADANGFNASGFRPDGSLRGVGFRSIFTLALGAQYRLSKSLTLRGGYSWNQNPIGDTQSSFNIASPLILQHDLYAGLSWNVTESLTLTLAYQHGFENSVTGPIQTPAGPIPGSTVTSKADADLISLGVTVHFGPARTGGDDGQAITNALE